MKTNKMRSYFSKVVFTFICLFAVGIINVNADTVTVTTEEELRDAVDGVKEVDVTDTDTTLVKLGADITLNSDLLISVITDLTIDLCGNTIDGHTNSKDIDIRYGGNGRSSDFTSGKLTIKDSGSSSGSIKSYNNIYIYNSNDNADIAKEYSLVIENGKFYSGTGMYSSRIFELASGLASKNITFNIQVNDGYFFQDDIRGNLIFIPNDFTKDNINLNIKLEKLKFEGSPTTIYTFLIYNNNNNMDLKLSDIVSDSSNVVLKTSSGVTKTLDNLDISASSYELLDSELKNYNTIEIIKTEGFDVSNVTLSETYGYDSATPLAIPIKNRGENVLQIANVTVDSANFIVERVAEGEGNIELAAGATDNTSYTIKAKDGLTVNDYTGVITVTDNDGKTYTATVTLVVNKKSVTGLGIGYTGNWKYGESPTTLNKYGVDGLSASQYKIDYSAHDTYDWKDEVPTLVGEYDVRIRVIDPNYDNTSSASSSFSILQDDTEIRIIAATNEWTYNGSVHRDTSYIVKYNGEVMTGGVLPTGDTISDVLINASVTDVVDNRENNNVIESFNLANHNCYSDVEVVAGTIKIKPITTPIVVTAGSASKTYNGSALTSSDYTYTEGVLIAGDTLTATMSGTQEFVGQSDNTVSSVKVMRGDKDITSNYTFGTHIKGTLKVESASQNLVIEDQFVVKDSIITFATLEQAVSGASGNLEFEVMSNADLVEYIEGTGYKAKDFGTVGMKVTALGLNVGGDASNEYSEGTQTFNLKIVDKEEVTISGLTNNVEFTYDGNAKKPAGTITVSGNKVPVNELEVVYKGTGSTTYNSGNAPSNAGTYSVTYKVPDTNTSYVGQVIYNFTIKKVKLEKVTLDYTSYEYTGSVISIPAPDNWDASLMESAGDFEGENVGNYSITVSLKDKNNYEWNDETNSDLILNWSITKADPDYENKVPTNLTGVNGQTLEDINLPKGFTWDSPTTALALGTHTYKATYTPEDINNYNIITNIDIKVNTKDLFNVTTLVTGGNGGVTSGENDVVEGTKKEITFIPDTGFMIDKVSVNGTEIKVTNNKLTLIVDEDKEVVVSYKKIPFTITVVDTEGASITPDGVVNVVYGDNKEFIITADSGYTFVKVLVNDVDKTSSMVGNKLTLNNITSNIEIEVVVERIVYEVIEGANQKYTITKDNEAKFRIDAEYGMFEDGGKVYVDDKLVDEENYTSEEGSTIITLKQSYVDTLSEGEHTLKAVFADDGIAITKFTVENVKVEVESPQTGDNIGLYIIIGILSVLGLIGTSVLIIRRKQIN